MTDEEYNKKGEDLQEKKKERWNFFMRYFKIQLGLQILIDVAAVFANMKKIKCLNFYPEKQGKCKMTDTLLNIILGVQYAFVMLNEILLIYAIWKMYKLIKGQANSEARTTQFLFAISIAVFALISVPFSIFYYPEKDTDNEAQGKPLMDWRWVEGFLNITQFQFQFTILSFCLVYATRPRPQNTKIE